MLTAIDVQSDILGLLKDHFSTGRTIAGLSQSSLKFSEEEENAGTLKIRPSEIVTQNDTSEDIPIVAVSYDNQTKQALGFDRGLISHDQDTGTSVYASIMIVPIYINCISSSDIESARLANYINDVILEPGRFSLIDKKGYNDMVFQYPGNPVIIRYIGPDQIIYATPLAGRVTLERVYEFTEKAETMTQISAFVNGQNVWNGGTTDG